jgi:hypothetical protein
MKNDRTKNQAEFNDNALILDELLSENMDQILKESLEVQDWSNRSGFDTSGYCRYSWEYEFRRRDQVGSYIYSYKVRIEYSQEEHGNESGKMCAKWSSDKFLLGQESIIKKRKSEALDLQQLKTQGIYTVVMSNLQKSQKSLIV